MNQPALISVIDQDEEIVIIDAREEEPTRPKPPINVSNDEEDDSPTLESLFPGGNGASDDDKDVGQLTQCGVARSAHNRIVAGEPAVGDEFPWMAQLDMIQKFGKRESTIDQIAGLTSSMILFSACRGVSLRRVDLEQALDPDRGSLSGEQGLRQGQPGVHP